NGYEFLWVARTKVEAKPKLARDAAWLADTAALACCVGKKLGDWKKDIPCGRDIKFGRDELIHYYYGQAVFNREEETWNDYRTATFDHLQANQNKAGSWPGSEGISVGPVYSTALWCTILHLEKHSHPSTRRDAPID